MSKLVPIETKEKVMKRKIEYICKLSKDLENVEEFYTKQVIRNAISDNLSFIKKTVYDMSYGDEED